jgi:arylsulfatase A-like enzyme
MAGKWGLGLQGTAGAPENKGWDFFSGLLHHVEGHFQQGDSAWKMVDGQSRKVGLPPNTYLNEWFTQEALGFIRQHKQHPFFLYLAFTLPHAELVVPPDYLKPYLDANGQSRFAPEKPQPPGQHYGPQPFPKAAYAAMVSQMDDYVGQVMAALRKLGIDKNTLVIFASDNGTHVEGGRRKEDVLSTFHSSGPLRGVKRDLYEGGIRVPFIARWPAQVKPGTTSAFTGAFWDLMPTLAQLAGAKGVAAHDGVSFLPVLKGKSLTDERALYWEFYEGGFKQAVRKGPWKAIRYYKGKNAVRTELYHLGNDVGEQQDLAASQPEKLREMEALMDASRETAEHPLFQIKP